MNKEMAPKTTVGAENAKEKERWRIFGITLDIYLWLLVLGMIVPIVGFFALPIFLASGLLIGGSYLVYRMIQHKNSLSDEEQNLNADQQSSGTAPGLTTQLEGSSNEKRKISPIE